MNAIEKHAGEVRQTAKSLSPQGRAELLRAIVHAVYDDVKLADPQGSERVGLYRVHDAAENHYTSFLG